MSRWPEDQGGRQPEGRRARHPEGRRARHNEGRRGRQTQGGHDPDDTLPWLAGLEEASSPEEDAEWAQKLRPRQARRVDMTSSDEPDAPSGARQPGSPGMPEAQPPATPGTGVPGAQPPGVPEMDWRAAEPALGAPLPEPGEQMPDWNFDDEPAPAEPGSPPRRDAGYASWAHDLDATAIWEPEPQDWTDPSRARPSWEPTDEPAERAWEPEESWDELPALTWEPEPRPADDSAATRAAPWEAGAAPSDTGFGSLFADPGADRPGTGDAAFTAAQAEARRLVEQATTQSWNLEPSWSEEDDRTGIDPLTDEPVVSFGTAPGRALEPAESSWDRPGPGPAAADPGTRAWESGEQAGPAGDEDWLWPVDQENEAHTSGGRRIRQPDGDRVQTSRPEAGTTIEGRRVRQLEGRSRASPASRSDGRRARQRDSRVRRRWPLRVAVLAWIVLFAIVCWLYIFPWLEGVLPENF